MNNQNKPLTVSDSNEAKVCAIVVRCQELKGCQLVIHYLEQFKGVKWLPFNAGQLRTETEPQSPHN